MPKPSQIRGSDPLKTFALLLLLLFLSHTPAQAGGGPETTLLVVNADSPLSLRIANEYVRLRDIPQTHVLWLHDIPSTGHIPISVFREKIWKSISEFIRVNRLDREIDAIVYSADFPYGVDFSADLKAARQPKKKYIGRTASLTSVTYFARRVALVDIGYLNKNHYFRDFAGPRIKTIKAVASAPRLTEKQGETMRKAARAALKSKDYEKAIGIYRKIVDSHPQSSPDWHDLARALAVAGRHDEAVAALSNAADSGWTNSLESQSDAYLKVLRENPDFIRLIRRMETAFQPIMQPHGFRNHYVWSNAGLTFWDDDDFKSQYYLSMLLAYTGARGNSFPEVMNYLRRSAASDGTRPEGTVYLMENSNVRSRSRQHLFPTTVDELARRGRNAEILNRRIPGQNGIIPLGKTDVIGVVVGSKKFDWKNSGSHLLPGAIAESLTSYGGHFNKGSQTKLTEFLRQGAAGSSGAVAEPYSFQEKFPVPLMHSYYADGCSLAEAFYQSVEYPFQLIIVGDPLARPFARFADIELESPDPGQIWSGSISLKPVVRAPAGKAIKAVELWIDGRRLSSSRVGDEIVLDTRSLPDGTHRLRLVGIEKGIIETRSYAGFDIRTMNAEPILSVDDFNRRVTYGNDIEITGSSPGGSKIELFQGLRVLGNAIPENGKWRIGVPSALLGLGPVSLTVRASQSEGAVVQNAALELTVTEPERLPAYTTVAPLNKGLRTVIHDKQGVAHDTVIELLKGRIKIPGLKKHQIDRLVFNGFFNVAGAGFYQFVVKTNGHIRLIVNDELQLDRTMTQRDAEAFVPLSLEAGWHKLQIEITEPGRSYLKILLAGDQIPALLGKENLKH